MSDIKDFLEEIPFDKSVDRLSFDDIEQLISLLNNGIRNWNQSLFSQLPQEADRKDFLAIMGNFYKRIELLEEAYYSLVDAAEKQMDFMKAHPTYQAVDPKFLTTISIMRDQPDVKKKWYRHKKERW